MGPPAKPSGDGRAGGLSAVSIPAMVQLAEAVLFSNVVGRLAKRPIAFDTSQDPRLGRLTDNHASSTSRASKRSRFRYGTRWVASTVMCLPGPISNGGG